MNNNLPETPQIFEGTDPYKRIYDATDWDFDTSRIDIEDLSDVVIEMKEKANEKGHLFAGVHKDEIVEEIKKQTQLDIHPDFIQLKEPIKEIGEHDIVVEAEGKKNKFKLKIGKIE